MPSTPRTLVTLFPEVLLQILEYVLTDTTDKGRAAVLCACRALYDTGIRLLYRHVYPRTPASWTTLFGSDPPGLLTVESGKDFAKHVRRLTLGYTIPTPIGMPNWEPFLSGYRDGTVVLPNCTHLAMDNDFICLGLDIHDLDHPAGTWDSRKILSNLSPTHLTLTEARIPPPGSSPELVFDCNASSQTVSDKLGPASSAWSAGLHTLHFEYLFYSDGSRVGRRVPYMSDWTIETVKISSLTPIAKGWEPIAARELADFIFDFRSDSPRPSGEGAYAGWGKVEVRVDPKVEEVFREQYTPRLPQLTSSEDKHLVSLIVFVDADGKERRLVE